MSASHVGRAREQPNPAPAPPAGGADPSRAPLIPAAALAAHPVEVARLLIGKLLVRDDGRAGRVVEAEAYAGPDDPASHAFPAPTARSAIMAGAPGMLYVYFSYGVHWCANVVCGPPGVAAAVLLRALEPVAGLDVMRSARWRAQRRQVDRDLCRGPGRLCQAMGIDATLAGTALVGAEPGPLSLRDDATPPPLVVATPRIGIRRAAERPWRMVAAHSTWTSRAPVPHPPG